MGIPDEDSYFRQSYVPTGRATGWRRTVLIVVVAILVVSLIAGMAIAFFG